MFEQVRRNSKKKPNLKLLQNLTHEKSMQNRYKEINLLRLYFTKHELEFCQVVSYRTFLMRASTMAVIFTYKMGLHVMDAGNIRALIRKFYK